MNPISKWIIGEILGTFILVFIGCSTVAIAVTSNGQVSLLHVAIIWGCGVTLAILITGQLSHAHLNPAVTIAFASFGGFPWKRVPGYILSQFLGAFIAAALVYATFNASIETYESANGIIRGSSGSEASAMIYGEFYPNPAGQPIATPSPMHHAFLAEFLGTALLVLVIFCVTHSKNTNIPNRFPPIFIGMTIVILITLFAPISQGGFNPARDLAPRLLSSFVGWGNIPFTTNGFGWINVYVVAPIFGGLVGAAIARFGVLKNYTTD